MRSRIINFIKYHSWIRRVYYTVGSKFFQIYGKIVKLQSKRILFSSFGGRKFDDSPRAIYENLKNDPDFSDWEFVWAFVNPFAFSELDCKKVLIDTLSYFQYALSSRVWITNTSIERGMRFKKDSTICINTWHGTPLKRMGIYTTENSKEYMDILWACSKRSGHFC